MALKSITAQPQGLCVCVCVCVQRQRYYYRRVNGLRLVNRLNVKLRLRWWWMDDLDRCGYDGTEVSWQLRHMTVRSNSWCNNLYWSMFRLVLCVFIHKFPLLPLPVWGFPFAVHMPTVLKKTWPEDTDLTSSASINHRIPAETGQRSAPKRRWKGTVVREVAEATRMTLQPHKERTQDTTIKRWLNILH